jgi:hypothetical protein
MKLPAKSKKDRESYMLERMDALTSELADTRSSMQDMKRKFEETVDMLQQQLLKGPRKSTPVREPTASPTAPKTPITPIDLSRKSPSVITILESTVATVSKHSPFFDVTSLSGKTIFQILQAKGNGKGFHSTGTNMDNISQVNRLVKFVSLHTDQHCFSQLSIQEPDRSSGDWSLWNENLNNAAKELQEKAMAKLSEFEKAAPAMPPKTANPNNNKKKSSPVKKLDIYQEKKFELYVTSFVKRMGAIKQYLSSVEGAMGSKKLAD